MLAAATLKVGGWVTSPHPDKPVLLSARSVTAREAAVNGGEDVSQRPGRSQNHMSIWWQPDGKKGT